MKRVRLLGEWIKGKYGRGVLTGLLTFLCLLALTYVSESRGLADGFGKGIAPVLLAGFIAWLLLYFGRLRDKRLKVISGIGGILLAFSHVYGNYLHYVNDLFVSPAVTVQQLFAVAGVGLFTVPLFALLLEGLQKAALWWQARQGTGTGPARHLFLKYWMGIFACYIPVFLCYWPVNFVYDAKYQLQEVVHNAYKIHHPILHTLAMGIPYKIGSRLGSVSVGISFYTLMQMLVLSASLAYALCYLYHRGAPRGIRVAAFLISALFPMNSLFAISATKDVLFAAFFLALMVLLLELCYHQEPLTWKKALWLTAAGSLMILFRRNALYALAVSVPFLVWAIRGKKRKLALFGLLAGAIVLSTAVNGGLLKLVHATNDDSIREAMSVPLQQLARTAAYRREDLDSADPAYYQEMLSYWGEGFASQYNPYLSDPIKNSVNETLLKSNMVNFFKLWGKVGLAFPGEYIESFLSGTMGYWYMGDTAHYMAVGDGIAVYHTLIGTEKEIVKHNLFPPVGWLFDPIFFHVNYNRVPILGFLFRSSTYFWMLAVFVLNQIYRRRWRSLLVISLAVIYYGSCFLGPFAALRYVYCVAVCWPLLAALCFQRDSGGPSADPGQPQGIPKQP